ncbi:zinc ribbon domain-containing protein [Diaphorobacter aerolatus]|nr:zinc ribbon domain-containing protein [Diaphorobacter aerolatus]
MRRSAGISCKNCGASVQQGARFCQQCGTSVVPTVCAQCQTPLQPGAKFCNQCGTASK